MRDDLRVNFLCLLGALLGAFAITLEWLTQTFDSRRFGSPMTFHFDLMGLLGSGLADEFLVLAAGLFLAGTLIAFITPTAGFMQLGGLVLFFGKVVPGLVSDSSIGLGAIFGVVSTILVLYSLFNPVGVGIAQESSGPTGNYLNVASRGERRGVNALCVIGAALAVIAIFLPWAGTTLVNSADGLTYEYQATPIDYISSHMNFMGVGTEAFAIAISILFAGVVLSFLTPLAGFIQLAGLATFYLNIQGYVRTAVDLQGYSFFKTELSYGFFVGLIAVGITVLSYFLTLEPRPARDLLKSDRLLTWTLLSR